MQPAFHGAQGDVQDLGHLFVGKVVEVGQDKHFAQRRWQLLDGYSDYGVFFGLFQVVGRGGAFVRDQREERLTVGIAGSRNRSIQVDFLAPRAAAEVIPGLVCRDGEKPGLQLALGIEARRRQMDLEKDVLDNVLGGGAAAGETNDKPEQLEMVALGQHAKRRGFPADMVGQQLLVRWRTHDSIVCLRRRGDRVLPDLLTLCVESVSLGLAGPGVRAAVNVRNSNPWRATTRVRRLFGVVSGFAVRYRTRSLNWGACALLVVLVTQVGGAVVADDDRGNERMLLDQPRIVVLKSKRELHLFDGDRLVKTYRIALGRTPVGQKECEGDGRTPEGRYRVVTRNRQSKYHRFLGLDYPSAEAVDRGVRHGLVTDGEARSIREALADGRCPGWTTALGGAIGIHGHGAATDWTAGCVALENRHAEQLFEVMRIGDEVEILP